MDRKVAENTPQSPESTEIPPPPPVPATANDPSPPESPSTPYLPRPLAFPRSSPNLTRRSDLQSNLEHSQHQHHRGSSFALSKNRSRSKHPVAATPAPRSVRSAGPPVPIQVRFGSSRYGIRHRLRQHLPPRRQRHQPGRPSSAAAEVCRGNLHHWHDCPPHPRPGHLHRLLRRHRSHHGPDRRKSLLSDPQQRRQHRLHPKQRPHPHYLRHQHLATAKPGPPDHASPWCQPSQHLS